MLGKTCSEKRRKGKLTNGRLRLLLALALKPPHSEEGGWRGRGEYSILLKD